MSDELQVYAFPGSFGGRGGMTLRDYFAAQAMAVIQQSAIFNRNEISHSDLAYNAYLVADAMMEEREKVRDED